jgi:signal transduction histidine kinase
MAQGLFLTCSMFGWLVMAHERRLAELKQEQATVRLLAQQASAADAAKTELMAALGHEVRNPLVGLAAVMELMLGTELTAEQREYAQIADDSILSSLRMTEDILELAKMQSSQPQIESNAFDLRNQIEGLAKIVKPLAVAKGIELGVDLRDPMPALVLGDEGRIRRVIMNLLMNAVKYTSHGQIRIAAAYDSQEGSQGALQVTVSDTGIGITPENIPTLFEKGGRAHASTEQAYGGSGIGLVMCKNLLDLMGGHLEVESQVNRGSTFKFSVPLRMPVSQPASPSLKD